MRSLSLSSVNWHLIESSLLRHGNCPSGPNAGRVRRWSSIGSERPSLISRLPSTPRRIDGSSGSAAAAASGGAARAYSTVAATAAIRGDEARGMALRLRLTGATVYLVIGRVIRRRPQSGSLRFEQALALPVFVTSKSGARLSTEAWAIRRRRIAEGATPVEAPRRFLCRELPRLHEAGSILMKLCHVPRVPAGCCTRPTRSLRRRSTISARWKANAAHLEKVAGQLGQAIALACLQIHRAASSGLKSGVASGQAHIALTCRQASGIRL